MTGAARGIHTPEELQVLMGTDFAPSPQQWAAITAPLQPAVVIAGAGSGKTSLMAARVVYLVATGQVEPDQVLGLTFTTKAASELAHRITGALAAAGYGRSTAPSGPVPPWDGQPDQESAGETGEADLLEPVVETYNAYAAGLLAEHGLLIGHEPDTRVMADASRYQLAARVIDRHTRPVRVLSDSPPHVIGYLLALDAALSEHLVEVADLRHFDALELKRFRTGLATGAATDRKKVESAFVRRAEVLDLVEEYRSLKAGLGLMDFSDQIAQTARLVAEQPSVGAAERDRFRVILLDEYQDTSVGQAQMLRRLFGHGHAVTAVGDPNQAIYGWRGASVSNILRFGEDFPRSDGEPVPAYPLTVNRRSDRRILEVANRLAAPLAEQFGQVAPLEPGTEDEGEVQVAVHPSYAEELAWLTEEVARAHRDGEVAHWRDVGVLVRDNAHAADVFDALTAAGMPVEIVGLAGLLRLPEVAEVLATLTLLDDLTANAELLTLLTGPRWAIGPRDLALLGRRASTLAGGRGRSVGVSLSEELEAAVAGADPTEVTALCDALEDLGDPREWAYSSAARQRFGLLAGELRMLRSHAGEPLLELVRRIIDACGIDLELDSSVSEAARARRENLDLFVKAVADFQAIDGSVTLPSLLAWLQAEDDLGNGLDVATPTEADSIKLLTVHRAKGLEWDLVVLVGACADKFPNTRGRGIWPTKVEALPTPLRGDHRDLPTLMSHDKAGLARLAADTKAHHATEELRLGYVAYTRARHRFLVSSYVWNTSRKTPLGPSAYQAVIREVLAEHDTAPLSWAEAPPKGTPNPLLAEVEEHDWPVTEQTAEARRRLEAAALVRELMAEPRPDSDAPPDEEADLDLLGQSRVQEWDEELDRLLEEARRERADVVEVPMPSSLSATSVARLRADPDGFARELVRPMPRPPSPAARFGTVFHAWVEGRFGQQPLLDPDELPGRGDPGIDDDSELQQLQELFAAGPFGDRVPAQVEAPFALVVGGRVVRGRIDAVYREADGWLLVDWKTGRDERPDPVQLAIYRLAWAELHGLDPASVRAAFFHVRSGRLVEPAELADRAELERILDPAAGTGTTGARQSGDVCGQ